MRKQSGLSLLGMLIVCIVIVFVAIGGLKVTPAYLEYFHIKKAVTGARIGTLVHGGVT